MFHRVFLPSNRHRCAAQTYTHTQLNARTLAQQLYVQSHWNHSQFAYYLLKITVLREEATKHNRIMQIIIIIIVLVVEKFFCKITHIVSALCCCVRLLGNFDFLSSLSKNERQVLIEHWINAHPGRDAHSNLNSNHWSHTLRSADPLTVHATKLPKPFILAHRVIRFGLRLIFFFKCWLIYTYSAVHEQTQWIVWQN